MSAPPFTLDPRPDWHAAASELVAGLGTVADADSRVRLLERICRRLGHSLYPAFLQILLVVERHADEAARRLVAGTLVDCLLSGRLPSGALSAWGSTTLSGDSAFGQVRLLGPIEYVCAWYAQPSNQPPLAEHQFDTILTSLLGLVGTDARAAALYRRKLESDADDPLGGALSNRTRGAIRELVAAWNDEGGPEPAVRAFREALRESSLLNELARGPFDLPL